MIVGARDPVLAVDRGDGRAVRGGGGVNGSFLGVGVPECGDGGVEIGLGCIDGDGDDSGDCGDRFDGGLNVSGGGLESCGGVNSGGD